LRMETAVTTERNLTKYLFLHGPLDGSTNDQNFLKEVCYHLVCKEYIMAVEPCTQACAMLRGVCLGLEVEPVSLISICIILSKPHCDLQRLLRVLFVKLVYFRR
jgi:hypothetical protein